MSASLAYKRDFLATASKDLTVRVWQTSPLRLVLTHMCHHSPLALSIDPYGRCAARRRVGCVGRGCVCVCVCVCVCDVCV